jgi:hypothetical protein
MTHEEYQKFKDEIFAEADNRYVAIDVCNEKQEKVNGRLANDDKRIDIIAHDFGIIKKLMWAMTSATIGSLVATVFEIFSK